MRCASCGERVAPMHRRCRFCGASAADFSFAVQRCPGCGYTGEGLGYFRRPGHLVLLLAVSVFTWGMGGAVYWFLRRRHKVCPRCGLGWGYALHGAHQAEQPEVSLEALPSQGLKRRVLGVLSTLIAAPALVLGVAGLDPGMVTGASAIGLGGVGTFLWGFKALQERRQALRGALERRVLRLATERGGTLTVTDVATSLDLSLAAAERILTGMDDGFRVRSDISEEGLLVFEFPEARHRHLEAE